MKTYSLTISTINNDLMMKIISELSKYDCNINIEKDAENKNYTFNYNEASYQRLGEKSGRTPEEFKQDQLFYDYMTDVLKSYGINVKFRGFRYIIECVRVMLLYGNDVFSLGLDIYPVVSYWYKVSQNSVEHDVRNAITQAWKEYEKSKGSTKVKNLNMSFFEKRPTNLMFLKHVCNNVRSKYSGL